MLSWVFTWISPSTFWGLGAALPAVLAEYLYRRLPGQWIEYWWLWTPIANYGARRAEFLGQMSGRCNR